MFQTIDDLPALIRKALPEQAQELYRAAYNRAWEKLSAGEDKKLSQITAESHNAARAAVDYEFKRDETGVWHHDPVGEDMRRNGRDGSAPDID